MAVRHSDCLEGGRTLSGTVLINVPPSGRFRRVQRGIVNRWSR
jgi:hypothetical protein